MGHRPTYADAPCRSRCSQLAVYCSPGKRAIGGRYFFDANGNTFVTAPNGLTPGRTLNIEGAGAQTTQPADATPAKPAGDRFEVRYDTFGIDPSRLSQNILIAVRCASVAN